MKSLTLWFGVLYVVLAFFARDAAEHISHSHPFWALWAGIGFITFWGYLRGNKGRAARLATAAVLGACAGLILYYQYLQYLGTTADYWLAEANAKYADQSLYRTAYGKLPRPRKMVGNPRLEGWKVVGVLYERGELKGDYRIVKESFAVPIWYTYGMPRSCFDDPPNIFVARTARGLPEDFYQLPKQGYGLTRVVLADGQPRLYLFERGAPSADPPPTFNLDDYRAAYDYAATPARYAQEPPAQYPLQVTFGGKMRLNGYDIKATQLHASDTLVVTLHWQAVSPMNVRYRAFVHVETDRMWGQHDDDPVCRLRTDEWRPPQAGRGQFRVTLDPAIPPGSYPVTVGVYNPDTGERLEAVDDKGQSPGSAVELTRITVER
jgi:hypothetical protein